jgi:hypothetical protein
MHHHGELLRGRLQYWQVFDRRLMRWASLGGADWCLCSYSTAGSGILNRNGTCCAPGSTFDDFGFCCASRFVDVDGLCCSLARRGGRSAR